LLPSSSSPSFLSPFPDSPQSSQLQQKTPESDSFFNSPSLQPSSNDAPVDDLYGVLNLKKITEDTNGLVIINKEGSQEFVDKLDERYEKLLRWDQELEKNNKEKDNIYIKEKEVGKKERKKKIVKEEKDKDKNKDKETNVSKENEVKLHSDTTDTNIIEKNQPKNVIGDGGEGVVKKDQDEQEKEEEDKSLVNTTNIGSNEGEKEIKIKERKLMLLEKRRETRSLKRKEKVKIEDLIGITVVGMFVNGNFTYTQNVMKEYWENQVFFFFFFFCFFVFKK
jgi:hypothetical protein